MTMCKIEVVNGKLVTAEYSSKMKVFADLKERAQSCFDAAERDVSGGMGYYPTDPMKKRVPEKMWRHNRKVKLENFKCAENTLMDIKKTYLEKAKAIATHLNQEERKIAFLWRREIDKLLDSCTGYLSES